MDIGWMTPALLESKLEQADTPKPEAACNLSRWPRGLDERGHRLFVACAGGWIGYFLLSSEALYLPEDEKTPFALLFDTTSWTEIPPVEARSFRGFTYDVPSKFVDGEGLQQLGLFPYLEIEHRVLRDSYFQLVIAGSKPRILLELYKWGQGPIYSSAQGCCPGTTSRTPISKIQAQVGGGGEGAWERRLPARITRPEGSSEASRGRPARTARRVIGFEIPLGTQASRLHRPRVA